MRKVLKRFSYGADGINAVQFTPDSPPSDFGSCTEGLAAAGYISKTDVGDEVPVSNTFDEAIETKPKLNVYKKAAK